MLYDYSDSPHERGYGDFSHFLRMSSSTLVSPPYGSTMQSADSDLPDLSVPADLARMRETWERVIGTLGRLGRAVHDIVHVHDETVTPAEIPTPYDLDTLADALDEHAATLSTIHRRISAPPMHDLSVSA